MDHAFFSSRALIRFPEQLTSVISLTDELILNAQSAKKLQTGAHNASVRAADAHRRSGRWGNNNRVPCCAIFRPSLITKSTRSTVKAAHYTHINVCWLVGSDV